MTSSTTFKAGLVQMRTGIDVAANCDAAVKLIRQAKAAGAHYVQTPETMNVMDTQRERLFAALAIEEHDTTLAAMRDLARDLKIHLHLGSVLIKLSEQKAANRSFLIGPDGEVTARYDKIHMFDVDLPNGEVYRESHNYAPGDIAVNADLPWGTLGMTICYDLRFPALYRALAEAGATLLAVPAAFTKVTGEAHWHVLLRARAIETTSFVMAAAQGGMHENGRATFGHSLIVDPWGHVLAEGGTEPDVIIAEIDPALVAQARARVPSLQHGRRFEIASPMAEPSYLHAVPDAR